MNIELFLKRHPALKYASDLKAICAPLDLLNLVYFSHAHIDNQNNFSGLGIVPEFFKLYFQKGYFNFDVHMANQPQSEQYIIWDTIQRKKQSQALHEDFTSFNQGHTFSIITHHSQGKDCYHFATTLGNEKMNGEYLQLIDNFKKFISYFKEKIASHKQLSKAYQLKIPLKVDQGGYLTDALCFDKQQFSANMISDRIYSPVADQYLTKREVECLYWFSNGKTIEETSIILGTTIRTIKWHLGNIKQKLACKNLFQLGLCYSKYIPLSTL